MESSSQKRLSVCVFVIYVILLTWLILFKFGLNLNELHDYRRVNWIPFQGSAIVNGRIELWEIIYNVIVFMPLGVYISIFKTDWSLLKRILPCFVLSICYEGIQYACAIGASDITDVIGNTLGGILGIILCALLRKLFKKKYITIINAIGLVVESIAIVLLVILNVANM